MAFVPKKYTHTITVIPALNSFRGSVTQLSPKYASSFEEAYKIAISQFKKYLPEDPEHFGRLDSYFLNSLKIALETQQVWQTADFNCMISKKRLAGCTHLGTAVRRLNCARNQSSESVNVTETTAASKPSTAYQRSDEVLPNL